MVIPETSVIMSVFNTEAYLAQAIDSVLNQTYRDFEFIIVNDGSTDHTLNMLEEYKKKDDRIVLMDNRKNIGVAKSLNIALNACRGKYVARMDPDDISLPGRLLAQITYMNANPDVGLLGSCVKSIDEKGRVTGAWAYPCDDLSIKWRLLFSNAFAHPSVVYKRGIVLGFGGYNEYIGSGIDFDLWVRMSASTRMHGLKEFLVLWRTHPESMTAKYGERRKKVYLSVIREHISNYLGIVISSKQAEELYRIESGYSASTSQDVAEISDLMEDMYLKFMKKHAVRSAFSKNYLLSSMLVKNAAINVRRWPAASMRLMSLAATKYFSPRAFTELSLYKSLALSIAGKVPVC
ncbi:MAG: glycosyltransferase [Candidatus Omnitrophica bacterium]|nr:glycosyltransferase [Candidatus Omnitrophota bacterium]